jgi:ATP-dependent Clp protease ATP-binding subunit ClpA
VSGNEIKKLKNLDSTLKKETFGQDQAIDTVVRAIKRSRAGLRREKKCASLCLKAYRSRKNGNSKPLANTLGIPL